MNRTTSRNTISTCGLLSLILGFASFSFSESLPPIHADSPACPGNAVPLSAHALGRSQISIPVTINQKGPFEFMVDTGSQITIIEPSLAGELQLQPVGTANLISELQSTPATLVSTGLIEAGPITVQTSWAVVKSLSQFQALYPELRGILGEDFFRGFDMLIDHRRKLLCLDPTSKMRQTLRGERVSIVRRSENANATQTAHPILIEASLLGETRRKLNLSLDSGASTPILYVDRIEYQSWSQRLKAQRGSVAGGSRMYFKILAPKDLQIGQHVLSGVVFVAPVRTGQDVASVAEDGLLPTSLFKRVFISYAGGFVIFEPN